MVIFTKKTKHLNFYHFHIFYHIQHNQTFSYRSTYFRFFEIMRIPQNKSFIVAACTLLLAGHERLVMQYTTIMHDNASLVQLSVKSACSTMAAIYTRMVWLKDPVLHYAMSNNET